MVSVQARIGESRNERSDEIDDDELGSYDAALSDRSSGSFPRCDRDNLCCGRYGDRKLGPKAGVS